MIDDNYSKEKYLKLVEDYNNLYDEHQKAVELLDKCCENFKKIQDMSIKLHEKYNHLEDIIDTISEIIMDNKDSESMTIFLICKVLSDYYDYLDETNKNIL